MTKPSARARPAAGPFEQAAGHGILFGRLQEMAAWGRKNSIWPFNFGLSCCYVEMATSLTSRYDIARYGSEVIRGTPREADLIVIAGTVFIKMAPVIIRLYEQMMEPRWVISMGSCANSGGMYDIYSVVQGVDKFLPVDLYVPGCPPRPDAFMEGLLMLREAAGNERRPLSWVAGPQGFHRGPRPCQRDIKAEARRKKGDFLPPEVIFKTGAAGPTLPATGIRIAEGGGEALPDTAKGFRPALDDIVGEISARFPGTNFTVQETRDEFPTIWVPAESAVEVLRFLKKETKRPYRMLYDLTAVDERERRHREGLPEADFSVVYHLLSFERNADLRVKVPLRGESPELPSVTGLWPSSDWYEREVFDMFGLRFAGHPRLRRILMPPTWQGHPLRKDHPARATDMAPFSMDDAKALAEQEALRFRPEEWRMGTEEAGENELIVNIGPQHPGTHGVLRVILRLEGERIIDAVCDIGYHHRGAEKMGERQSWHTYIPYTDRVDYLGGVMNNLPYCLAAEKLAGIDVPDRAKFIRVLLCELFRLSSHLVWYGTFAQDLGQLSPIFYMFTDRERILDIVAAVTGARMHPNWFRIGGTAQDLPQGWEDMVSAFIKYFRPRLKDYDGMVIKNRILKARSIGIGAVTLDEAIEWGVTGPMLRACGLEWDFRKKRPYSGYEAFAFDIPTGRNGDVYDRALVRVEEMRQSLRIIEQCLKAMPPGDYKSRHPLAAPPIKDMTLTDIETLINHFLGVTWGPVMPPGEAFAGVEATKGNNGYYLTSDGGVMSYRTRIRTPSFPHIQMVPLMTRGFSVPDFVAILGSIDFVLSDVDK